jgi:RecB family exonuclease
MLADLRALVADPAWQPRGEILTEQRFRYTLGHDVEISGRIDRIDKTPTGATVIDYKYSAAQNTKALGKDDSLLQPQLYMLALERSFGLRPEGMAYWGFKKQVERTPLIQFAPAAAIESTLRIAGEVRAGRIEPHPADAGKCRLCELLDVCRYRAARAAAAEGEPAWD